MNNSGNDFCLVNGRQIRKSRVVFDPSTPFLSFGFGLFESLRYQGRTFYYHEHIRRLKKAAKSFGLKFDEKKINEQKIDRLVRSCGFSDEVLKIKIMLAARDLSMRTDSIVLVDKGRKLPDILSLATHPEIIDTPAFRWKTLNFMYTISLLKKYKGKRDFLRLDRKGRLVEAGTANIALVKKDCLLTVGRGANILPGVTQALLEKNHRKWFKSCKQVTGFKPEEIKSADALLYMNSMVGIREADKLDGYGLKKTGLAADINSFLFR